DQQDRVILEAHRRTRLQQRDPLRVGQLRDEAALRPRLLASADHGRPPGLCMHGWSGRRVYRGSHTIEFARSHALIAGSALPVQRNSHYRLCPGSVEKMPEAGSGDTAIPGREGAAQSGPPQSGRALRMAFVLDVAEYGTRPVPDRDDVQRRLRHLVVAMLAECGLTLSARVVDHQWTGDGVNAVLPSDIDPPALLSVLLRSLAALLSEDNGRHPDRIRLRMALGVGLIERRAAGFGGPVIVDINR